MGRASRNSQNTLNLIMDLKQDGILSYRIEAENGDFYVDYAVLTATVAGPTSPSPVKTPDGGATVAFLGLGLLGLAGINRRFSSSI